MSTKIKPVSKAKAEAVFKRFLKKYEHWDTSEATLILDWDNGHPAICWEGYCYEWAIAWDNEVDSPKGVFCEAYYSCVLCIYPE